MIHRSLFATWRLARLLDRAAIGVTAWLGAALLIWSGWSKSFWMRPEHVVLFLLGIVSVRLLIAPVTIPAVNPRRVVGIGVAVYALGFSFITVTRHLTFRTHALDLGYYVQLTWSVARGHGPYVSLPEMNAWGDHLSPIMYAFVPLFWLVPSAAVLLVAQSVILALGGLAVFVIARRRLHDDRPAAAFGILYLLNPSLHGINVRDFHAAALAIPLLLFAFFAAETGRPWLLVITVMLILSCREDAALAVIGLGVWLALGRRHWLAGAAMCVAASALLVGELRWIIPYFRHAPYVHLWRYEHFGQSPGEIAATIIMHPLQTLGDLVTRGRFVYGLAMLAPFGFLPLFGGWDLVGAAPALASNLLSSDPVLYNHRAQYQAFLLPFLILAAIAGYSRLVAWNSGRQCVHILAVSFVLTLALASPAANDLAVARWWPNAEQRAAHAVLARIPPTASVSAQDRYVAHLSLRRWVTVFPVELDRAEYVVLNVSTYPWRALPDVTLEREGSTATIVTAGSQALHYEVVIERGPHLLLHRL